VEIYVPKHQSYDSKVDYITEEYGRPVFEAEEIVDFAQDNGLDLDTAVEQYGVREDLPREQDIFNY
jgi:hypothetical protein